MQIDGVFTPDVLNELFPDHLSDMFFDALYGDAGEGVYDIRLKFKGHRENRLEFELHLVQRAGKCLNCHLTYGLPSVFSRHPIINIKGLVQNINKLLDGFALCTDWQLGSTREVSSDLHVIPLIIFLDKD
ncbi:MAG: pancreas/duodenum homeobox protein 1 [Desulfobacterales bacterium]|nr:MAG: pancreas/duodenum homeobox protein 1 [Desulfobacterales bacterium]